MPINSSNHFWVHGSFQEQSISRMTTTSYNRACNSSPYTYSPYPTVTQIMTRVGENSSNDMWYQDDGADLHLCDFLLVARIQTAQRLSMCCDHNMVIDLVMERATARAAEVTLVPEPAAANTTVETTKGRDA